MKLYEGNHLGIARARIEPGIQYLMPDAFILFDMLPSWENARVKNYTTRRMDADFMECMVYIDPAGKTRGPVDNGCENFMYVRSGTIELSFSGTRHILEEEGYFWLPPETPFEIRNAGEGEARVLWVKKVYEPTELFPVPKPIVSSVKLLPEKVNTAEVKQECLPFEEDLGFDMAMNMLTYYPGVSFPRVEIHVNVHGAYFLNGRGGMWLNGAHHEMHEDDFCYMAPYTPHYAVAYGPAPMRYLLFKNANRDYRL